MKWASRTYQCYTQSTKFKWKLRPICQQFYCLVHLSQDALGEQINKRLEASVLEPSQSEWRCSIALVSENDGTFQVCVNYWLFNAVAIPEVYLLLRLNRFIDSLVKVRVLTALNASWRYWEVPIKKKDLDKTTFTSYFGFYRYTYMPFGLWIVLATFQSPLDINLF